MRFEHICNAPVEALDHAVGLWCSRLGQAMLNVQSLAQLVEFMAFTGLALTPGKQPVCELLAIVRQDLLYVDWAGLVQGAQKRACSSGCLVALDLNKHPACGTVNGYKQEAPAWLVWHLRQVLDIDV